MMAPPTPQPQPTASSSSSSTVKHFERYFAPAEVEHLTTVARGKQSIKQAEGTRLAACAFGEFVGARLGFPRRTIATAQLLYHRFHLFFPLKDFPSYYEPILAALYVSSKLHDTLKKPREIVLASYGVRYPDLLGGRASLSETDIDPATLEADRLKVLAIERLVLETVCFNFSVQTSFTFVLRFSKALGASKALSLAAYRIAIDCYRTLLPLSFPPHALALASLYVAALLGRAVPQPVEGTSLTAVEERAMMMERARAGAIEEVLAAPGAWEERFAVCLPDIEQITHSLMDLFVDCVPMASRPSNGTPSTPSRLPALTPEGDNVDEIGSSFSTTCVRLLSLDRRGGAELTAVKIELRRRAAARVEAGRPADGRRLTTSLDLARREAREQGEGVGRNEGTVRFLFS